MPLSYFLRAYSLMDRISGFGPEDRGSIPRRLIFSIANEYLH